MSQYITYFITKNRNFIKFLIGVMVTIFQSFHLALLEQRSKWVLWIPVFFAVGVGGYFALFQEPSLVLTLSISFFCVFMWFLTRKIPIAFYTFTCLLCASLGLTWAQVKTYQTQSPILSHQTSAVLVIGQVVDIDKKKKAYRVTLKKPIIESIKPEKTPAYVRIRISNKIAQPDIGDKIEVLSILSPPSMPSMLNGFDYQRYAYFKQLGAIGYAVGYVDILEKAPEKKNFKLFFENLRQNIGAHISDIVKKGDRDSVIVATALLTGERGAISNDLWDIIRKAGIAHLLAISGLHIGLVAGFAFALSRALLASVEYVALEYPIKKISAVIAFLMACFYMFLIGAPVSSQRALLMTGVVLFAIVLDRVPMTMRLVSFAAMVVLIISPYSLLNAGFHMSFAAVMCLVAFYEALSEFWKKLYYDRRIIARIRLYFIGCFVTTLIASLATAPFALYHFQKLAFFPGLLTNLMAVPLMAFWVMPFGFLSLILMPFGLDTYPLQIMVYGVNYMLNIAEWGADISFGVWKMPAMSLPFLLSVSLGGVWLIIWSGWIRWLGLCAMVMGAFYSIMMLHQHQADITIHNRGKLMAVRLGDGNLSFSSKRAERFIRNNWMQRNGQNKALYWSKDKAVEIICDDVACLYTKNGIQVSFVKKAEAFLKDCHSNIAIIISPEFAVDKKKCAVPYILDRLDIGKSDHYEIFVTNDGDVTVKKQSDIISKRPWR